MTALRSGTNKLRIDYGRREQLTEMERVCLHCSMNEVENEVHFVIFCPKYAVLRSKLYQKILEISINKWKLETLSWKDCFILLINGSGDEYQTSIFSAFQNFLINAFKLRDKNHK